MCVIGLKLLDLKKKKKKGHCLPGVKIAWHTPNVVVAGSVEPGGCGTDSNSSAQPAQHCSVAGLGSDRLGLQDEADAPEQTFPGSFFLWWWWWFLFGVWLWFFF